MKAVSRLGSALAAVAITAASGAALAGPASAATTHDVRSGASHAVFVQTDNPNGNRVVAYDRSAGGTLTLAHSYPTNGRGGVLTGSAVDHLASQGSLTYDPGHALLYAVNAGSNTLSVFAVSGDTLRLQQVISSGGRFPVSVAVRGNLVYAVNAKNGGSLQGYWVVSGHLVPIPGSKRALGLTPPPTFTETPGQVAFSPDGSQLIVTTKANGSDIDVFAVHSGGRLSAGPVVNSEPGTVPFGITFDQSGHLVIADAGTDALASYALAANGTVSLIDSAGNSQAATCWVAPAGSFLYASNAGSGDVSGYAASSAGSLTLLGETATDPGTVDASASAGGHFLYVQTGGSGIVDEYHVGSAGSLTEIGSVTVAGAVGGEGIVAF
jgi:6-phosphogluconolactonase (cycloisomerase 2 family)